MLHANAFVGGCGGLTHISSTGAGGAGRSALVRTTGGGRSGAGGTAPQATVNDPTTPINARDFTVRLAPGAGATLMLAMKRYANPPTAKFPWDR